jgi:hypothetical protein
MKRLHHSINIGILTTLALGLTKPAFPQTAAGSYASGSGSEVNNVFCARNLKASVSRISKTILPEGYSDLKDVQLTSDFRNPANDLPWSTAIAINDPVTGQSVGVLDQNFVPGGSKVVSSWGRYSIAVSGYWLYRTGGGAFQGAPVATFVPFEADILWIPDGESFLIVKGCNGVFTVTPEVANALANQPPSKNAYIRFSTEEGGGSYLSQIGIETVKSWKKVYSNWKRQAPAKVESLGF